MPTTTSSSNDSTQMVVLFDKIKADLPCAHISFTDWTHQLSIFKHLPNLKNKIESWYHTEASVQTELEQLDEDLEEELDQINAVSVDCNKLLSRVTKTRKKINTAITNQKYIVEQIKEELKRGRYQ